MRTGDEATAADGTTPEPPLRQVLADPIVHLVMRRDGLSVEDVRAVLQTARARLLVPPGKETRPSD